VNNPERATRAPVRRWWIAALAVFTIAAAGVAWYSFGPGHHGTANTDAAMATRAQHVMPFDLNRTTHTFTKTADGGIETVVVDNASDTADLALIRTHLRTEAQNFRRGNYSDPAKIHGMDMPGVTELEAGAARVKVVYAQTRGGAQITYTSTEPTLTSALHAWFDRQASDHSLPGMGG
jgi:hypothetical protein